MIDILLALLILGMFALAVRHGPPERILRRDPRNQPIDFTGGER